VLGPEGKVVVDGLPRAVMHVEVGPLAARSEDVGNAIENVTERQGTGAACRCRVQGEQVVEQDVGDDGVHVVSFLCQIA
jgi:hypothetical protein